MKNNIRKIIREEIEKLEPNHDSGTYSEWYLQKDYNSKKKMFVWDAKEYLTGYFGTVGLKNEKEIMKRLDKIFDHAMSSTHEHGISFFKDNGYEYKPQIKTIAKYLNTDDDDLIYDIIDSIFNQE